MVLAKGSCILYYYYLLLLLPLLLLLLLLFEVIADQIFSGLQDTAHLDSEMMFVGGVRQEAESQQREEETTAADWSLRAVLMRESV